MFPLFCLQQKDSPGSGKVIDRPNGQVFILQKNVRVVGLLFQDWQGR